MTDEPEPSYCMKCYLGEPHAGCAAQLRTPVTREVGLEDVRDRVARLEKQLDACAREVAHFRAHVPDLNELRRLKELASAADYYAPLRLVEIAPGSEHVIGTEPVPYTVVLRALVCNLRNSDLDTVWVKNLFLGMERFLLGAHLNSAVSLANFMELVRQGTSTRWHANLQATLILENRGAHPVSFSGAFVCKVVKE